MLGLGSIAKKVFGSSNDRKVKSVRAIVEQVNRAGSPNSRSFPTKASSKRRPSCANARRMARSSTIFLPEAFANCREAARRALGLRAFDVQLVGGIFPAPQATSPR